MRQAVGGSAQCRVSRIAAVLIVINELLQVFHTHPGRKVLRFHIDLLLQQTAAGILGTVPQAEQDIAGGERSLIGDDSRDAAVLHDQPLQRTGEADLSTEADDLFPDIADNVLQDIGAEMGHSLVQDGRIRAGFHEFFEKLMYAGILDAGGQLSVGEGSGTAFSELYIAGRVQNAVPEESLYVPGPFLHGFSPFDDDGSEAAFSENQAGCHTGRTESHDGRSFFGNGLYQAVFRTCCFLYIPKTQKTGFIAHFCQDGVAHTHFVPAGIDGFPFDFIGKDIGRRTAQLPGDILTVHNVSWFTGDLVDSDHGLISILLRNASFSSAEMPSLSSMYRSSVPH